jgi:hypothetical protein
VNGSLQTVSYTAQARSGDERGNIPLSSQGDNGPVVSLLVNLLLNLGAEGDGAHDSIAKLLVQHGLVGIAVVLHDLVQSVDERLDRWHGTSTATVWEAEELLLEELMVGTQDLR